MSIQLVFLDIKLLFLLTLREADKWVLHDHLLLWRLILLPWHGGEVVDIVDVA